MEYNRIVITVSKPFNQYGISLNLRGPKCSVCEQPIIVTDEMSQAEKEERINILKDALKEHGYVFLDEDLQYFLPACQLDENCWVHEYCLEDDANDDEI